MPSDIKTIEAAFSHLSERPKKPEIEEPFESNSTLRDVMQGHTLKHCYEKVKTIFRQQGK